MQALPAYQKWFEPAAVALALAGVALYAFTGTYLFLAVPFVALFIVLMLLNWKLAYWVLLFTIPLSTHLEFFNATLSTTVPDEPMMWLFLLLFVLLLASRPRDLLPEWWWRNPLTLILALQYLWLIVAVIFTEQPLVSVKFLMAKTWFLVSFLMFPILVFREKKDFRTAFWLLLIPMVLTMLIIIFRHMQWGFNFRKVEKAISPIYYNHVEYSTVISMFFPVLCMALPLTKGKPLWIRLSVLGLILFFLPAIYLTYARAAMVAIVFAAGIGVAIRLRLVNWVMPVFYGVIALLVVYLARNNNYIDLRPNYERTYMHGNFASHMAATFRGQDMSSMERLYRWIAAVRMSEERPWTGVGPNAFYNYYKPYAVSSFRTYVSRNPERSTTHNYFLYMLVEQGWPAMILYGILIVAVFARAQRIYHRFKDPFYRYCTLGIAMMFAAGFINNFFSELLETHKVGALFYISIALLIVLDRKSKEQEAEQGRAERTSLA
jgi:O-antigen ligase